MLKHWQFHQEYLPFLHETKIHFDSSSVKGFLPSLLPQWISFGFLTWILS
ncbi:MAG: hypothetical protein ACLRV9_10905 [Clostridium sp.]